jgi:hypothetical protein
MKSCTFTWEYSVFAKMCNTINITKQNNNLLNIGMNVSMQVVTLKKDLSHKQ